MPNFGDYVTVRALVNMPGVDEGTVVTVAWAPRLAKLVRLGRYEIVENASKVPSDGLRMASSVEEASALPAAPLPAKRSA